MMKKLLALTLALAPLAGSTACVGTEPEADELEIGDADLGELGAADVAGGLYTYYELRQDVRRCIHPLCGGYWVSRVNRAQTTCADGSRAEECYVAELDLSALGLSDQEIAAVEGEARSGRALVRGRLATRTISSYAIGALVASEAWTAPRNFTPEGVYVLVTDNGIRCITYPCASLDEEKLNSSLRSTIAEIDLAVSGATDEEIARAHESLAAGGLIVAGHRYTVRGPGGRARARTGMAFWTRVVHQETSAGACYVGGCSSQICSERQGFITTCEWRPEYACYQTATCERQADGRCGWTETPELDACLAGSI